MATAARPRPRPVPRVKATPAASSSTQEPSPVAVAPVADDDAMFVRNKGRSAQTWKKLDKMTRVKPKTVHSDTEGESDSPPSKKKKKAAAGSTEAKIQRLMSETMSDDSDSDVVEVTGASGTPKRKKRRSRSRSITPPPSVAKHQLLAARELVRKALNTAPRAPSPTIDDPDESTDTIIFDPELQKIARSAAAEVQRASSSEPVGGDPTDTLEITVKWQPHPLNENGKASTAVFRINRTDTFEDLFAAVADDEGILPDNVVMAYRGVRVYPTVTSAVLKLWIDAEFTACTKITWDYIKANPGAGSTSNNTQQAQAQSDIEVLSDTEDPTPNADQPESDAESEGGETFKLCLRSAVTKKDIFLTVRPTTTCGAIVQAFLKKAGLADKYGSGSGGRKSVGGKGKKAQLAKEPQLVIDGDKMASDVLISEADLDDGDVVDVFLP